MSAHESLSPDQFAGRFKPAYYSDSWKGVEEHPDFQVGGDQMWDLDDLTDSIAKHGMRDPVQVEGDEVTEGHHRVVAALRANRPVKYQRW